MLYKTQWAYNSTVLESEIGSTVKGKEAEEREERKRGEELLGEIRTKVIRGTH